MCPCDDNLAPLLFFHGKESGPFGSKYRALSSEFSVTSPDFQGLDIWERLEKAEFLTEGMEDALLVGSSYGGLLAALLYSRHPGRFKGYVLLAPAFYPPHAVAMSTITRVPDNAVVIHGTQDEIVPLSEVEDFCNSMGLPLVVVEDGHRLKGSYDEMMEWVQKIHSKATQAT